MRTTEVRSVLDLVLWKQTEQSFVCRKFLGEHSQENVSKEVNEGGLGKRICWTVTWLQQVAHKLRCSFRVISTWGKGGWGFEHLHCLMIRRKGAITSDVISLWLRAVSGDWFTCEPSAANTPGNWGNECLGAEGGSGWLSTASTTATESFIWTTIISQLDHCNGLQTGFLFYTAASVIVLELSSYHVAMATNYF